MTKKNYKIGNIKNYLKQNYDFSGNPTNYISYGSKQAEDADEIRCAKSDLSYPAELDNNNRQYQLSNGKTIKMSPDQILKQKQLKSMQSMQSINTSSILSNYDKNQCQKINNGQLSNHRNNPLFLPQIKSTQKSSPQTDMEVAVNNSISQQNTPQRPIKYSNQYDLTSKDKLTYIPLTQPQRNFRNNNELPDLQNGQSRLNLSNNMNLEVYQNSPIKAHSMTKPQESFLHNLTSKYKNSPSDFDTKFGLGRTKFTI